MTRFFIQHNRACLVVFIVFWVVSLTWVQTLTSAQVLSRMGVEVASWEPLCWELSSHLALLILLVPLIKVTQLYPLGLTALRPWFWHVIAFVPFTLLHITLMVMMRELWYGAVGWDYDFGDWWLEGAFEVRLDLISYIKILAMIYLWQLILWRAKGEATWVEPVPDRQEIVKNPITPGGAGEPEADACHATQAAVNNEKLLIKKLGREYWVDTSDVLWVEASGNYVNLHAASAVYPMRATMAATELRFKPKGFQRIHRSTMVNLAYVDHIRTLDSGDYSLTLTSGLELNLSRRYRDDLKLALQR